MQGQAASAQQLSPEVRSLGLSATAALTGDEWLQLFVALCREVLNFQFSLGLFLRRKYFYKSVEKDIWPT